VHVTQVYWDGLPPGLCQSNVANFRRSFRQRIIKQHRSEAADPSVTFWMVTIIAAEWVAWADSLSSTLLRDMRAWAYRRLLKAESVRLFWGVIDFTWSISEGKEESRFWQPHVHAIVAVSDEAPGKYLRKIFRSSKSKRARIHRPVRVQQITALEGAIEYCTKALLIDGPVRRSTWINADSGKRMTAKFSLQRPQQIEIARLMMASSLDDRVIKFPNTAKASGPASQID